jgi:hypothetical protein
VTKCELCGSGPVFAGHAEVNGDVVDIYHPCACVEPDWADDFDPIFLPELPSHQVAVKIVGEERVKFLPDPDEFEWEPYGTAHDDFHPFNAAKYEGL